jgi:flagella basal body P-ring formation protein FlgA
MMIRALCLGGLGAAWLATAGAEAKAPGPWTLALRETVHLPAGVIRLGDVTARPVPAAAESLTIAVSRQPAGEIVIDRRRVLRLLAQHQLAAGLACAGPESCTVILEGRRIETTEIESRLLGLLNTWLPEVSAGAPPPWLEWELHQPQVAVGPEWSLEISNPRPLHPGRNLVPLQIVTGRQVVRWTCLVTCHAYAEVGRLQRSLAAGEMVAEADVTWEWLDFAQGDADAALSRPEVLARQAARPLSAGRLLRKGDLKEIPWVRRGEPVELRLSRGEVTVSVRATARQDAYRGQNVPVRNELNGRVVIGRVVGPGVVQFGR